MQDLGNQNSGHLPPILHPLKNPSKLSQVPGDYIYDKPDFKYNLPKNYMVPTNYKWKITTRDQDHYVQYSSKNNEQYHFWQEHKFKTFQLQYTFLKPTKQDLSTDPSFTTTAKAKRQTHRTYEKFLELKESQNFIFLNKLYSSPFTLLENYRIDPQATIGTLRNYDAVKQVYLFKPNCNSERMFSVPQQFVHMIDPDNPSSQESDNSTFSFNSPFNQQITIGNFPFTTCDFVNTVCQLLEPHVIAAPLLIQWI